MKSNLLCRTSYAKYKLWEYSYDVTLHNALAEVKRHGKERGLRNGERRVEANAKRELVHHHDDRSLGERQYILAVVVLDAPYAYSTPTMW